MDPQLPLRKTLEEIATEKKEQKERDEEKKRTIREFADYLKGEGIPVYLPGEENYERSVAIANLLYRFARPGCVVQPLNTTDVQTVIREARQQGIPMTIKGGGHSHSGFSTANTGISLDLGKMNKARLDTKKNPPVMTMQGGAQWGHAYKHLINGKHDGYMVNGGRCPTVGVGGFILGGGLTPFGRSLGLGCDSLLEATIVTADGEIITVSRKDLDVQEEETDQEKIDRKDLFWALCGAGGGNFGVVVEFKLAVHRLQEPEDLLVAGKYEWTPLYKPNEIEPERYAVASPETLATLNRFYSYKWPNECTIDSSWVYSVNKPLFVRFLVYYDGTKQKFIDLIDPKGENGEELPDEEKPITNPALRGMLKRRMIEEPSTRFLHETLVDQWSEEIVKAFPNNKSFSLYTSFVFPNDIETIDKITKYINKDMGYFQERFAGETAKIQVTWIHSGGKVSQYGGSATAYPWRKGVYNVYVMLEWDGKWLEKDLRGWLQKFRENLREHSLEKRAAYVNFPFPDETYLSRTDYEHAYYGKNCERLREVKAKWDPDRYFEWSQGVQFPKPRAAMNTFSIVAASAIDAMTVNKKKSSPDDRKFADSLAREQWKTYEPSKSWSSGGIHALTDLGF